MTYLYIQAQQPFAQIKKTTAVFEAAGYDTDAVRLGVSWEEFLGGVPDGATVVVYSVDFFPSLMELLSTLAALQERRIVLKSIKEPWLGEPVGSTAEFLFKLKELAVALHQNRTQQGIAKARAAGKRIGRPRKRA